MTQAGHQGVSLKWDQVVFSSDEQDQNSQVGETEGQEPATCVSSQGLLPGVSIVHQHTWLTMRMEPVATSAGHLEAPFTGGPRGPPPSLA